MQLILDLQNIHSKSSLEYFFFILMFVCFQNSKSSDDFSKVCSYKIKVGVSSQVKVELDTQMTCYLLSWLCLHMILIGFF